MDLAGEVEHTITRDEYLMSRHDYDGPKDGECTICGGRRDKHAD